MGHFDFAGPPPGVLCSFNFVPTGFPGSIKLYGSDSPGNLNFNFALDTVTVPQQPQELDWGDAPDAPYPTLSASTGASHVIMQGMMLGTTIDAEPDGQPDPAALGDDNNGTTGDDEDGVTFVSNLYPGNMARIDVTVADPTGTAFLNAWIDYNGNGVWEASEQIATDMPVVTDVNKLYPNVPTTAGIGQTFARFRLSTQSGLEPSKVI